MRAGLFERHLASADDPAKFLATREARQPIGASSAPTKSPGPPPFLLSPAASAIFGSTLTADGGLTTGFDFRTGAEGSPPEPHTSARLKGKHHGTRIERPQGNADRRSHGYRPRDG